MKLLSFLVALIIALPAAAQDYPNKPIRIITAFGAGTATDVAARVIGAEIASQIGQSVVIENKPGAEGQIAAQAAAAAAPDGYTLFFTTQTTQAINPHVYKTLAYDPVKSFTPIAGITQGPQIVMVRNDLPAKTIGELIALAKAQPGKLSFGSGNGSSRGGAELFKIMTKVDLLGVPYKTQPQAVADLLGGRIDVIFSDFTAGLPPVLDGRARGLAVTSKEKIPGLEQFPTVAESGVPGFEIFAWTALYAPAGTPKPIVDKLNALVRKATESTAYRNLVKTTYGTSFTGSPEDLAAFQAAETKKWGEIVTTAGMKEP
ncbi:Bug family tripartite tricarboxylate transporter substrate binding protein [Reyranella massiliensis]|uniref:Bug family tripartite tricarboxylate transporter substrate binding protein n=1 Tax=Reyranella massiliensis TaxID=445220 RepID=UPI00031988F3|nr:tripartite tricarboxylate transporter substrate binding protein [Reyranella massiliensis]